MTDWFKCCEGCPKRYPGCCCSDYKKAKIKRELEKRWLVKKAREESVGYSPGLRKAERREFIKNKAKGVAKY